MNNTIYKSKKHNIVYKTTNTISNKIYIGVHSTNKLNDGYLGSGKIIKSSIKKYGEDNFTREILFDFDSIEDALEIEKRIVSREFTLLDSNYNISIGGGYLVLYGENNGFFGKKHTKELKELFSKNNPMHCSKAKEKVSKSLKQWFSENEVSQETRDKLSKASKGRKMLPHVREDLIERMTGRVVSQETKNRISKAKLGVKLGPFSDEHKKKLSESTKGIKRPYVIETNKNKEKIRKTALTHTGMKRSEQAKINIKLSKCKFIWMTPFGEFISANDFVASSGLSEGLLRNRCLSNNTKIIKLSDLNRAKDLTKAQKEASVGLTWNDLGWSRKNI